jgi:hypothetical protein
VRQLTDLVSEGGVRQYLARTWESLTTWSRTPVGKTLGTLGSVFMTCALLTFVAWRLFHIGWNNILHHLPISALFFASLFVCYLIQPVGDFLIYKRIWHLRWRDVIVFFRKRSLNEAVMDYSGEAYLFTWAKRLNVESGVDIARTVRDVNLLSGVVSNLTTLAILAIILLTGASEKIFKVNAAIANDVFLGGAAIIATAAIVVGFRRFFLSMSGDMQIYAVLMHTIRNLLVMVATLALWHFAVPAIAATDWLVFFGVQLLAYRFPFIPNRDLLMAGVGMALAASLGTAATAVASMFATVGALFLISNLALVALTSGVGQIRPDGEDAMQR